MKRSALKRKTPLRARVQKIRADEFAAARAWRQATIRTGCVMCRSFPPSKALRETHGPDFARLEAHHIIAQRHLKQLLLHAFLWDERNGVGMCAYHHVRHENYRQRIPRNLLPAAALEFVAALGIDYLLDLEYPKAARVA